MTCHLTTTTGVLRYFLRATAALFLCWALPSLAADKTFDIPAGPAVETLQKFSKQSGAELLYTAAALKGVQTSALQGALPTAAALDRLLSGTPLVATQDPKTGGFAINREGASSPNVNRAIAENSDRPTENAEKSARNAEGKVVLDTFEVFSKKSLNMDVKRTQDDIQPYVIFDQKAIQASGVTTLEAFLMKSVTSASMSGEIAQQPGFTVNSFGTQASGAGSIRLRGLNPSETLILVDGRRLAPRGHTGGAGLIQADLNGIPLSAIERIDVLPTSASGIYGSNAVGGVINIILRRDYAAVQLAITYGNTFDTDVNYRRIELNGGYTFENGRTNLMFALSGSDGGELWLQDRDFRDRYFAINRASLPSTDSRSVDSTAIAPPIAATANIRSTNGQNLTLKSQFGGGALNSLITSVPAGYAGPAFDNGAGFIAAAGKYNYEFAPFISSGGTVLRHTPEQFNYLMTLRREMSPWLSLFLDASGSRTNTTRYSAGVGSTVNLSATDQGNPFSQPISVQVPGYGTEGINEFRQTAVRLSSGAIIKLPADWNLGLDYTWDENSSATTSARVVNVRATGGINSAVAAGTLNVFRDERLYPNDYSSYFFSTIPETSPLAVKGNNAALRASGPLTILPSWHPVQISASVEYIDQALGEFRSINVSPTSDAITRFFYSGASQSSNSVYTELKWPLIISEQKISAIERFEIFVAGRHDSYRTHSTNPPRVTAQNANWTLPVFTSLTTKLEASTPMVGIIYQPIKDISFRANYSEGFLPPTVAQLIPDPTQFGSTLLGSTFRLQDSQRGNEFLGPVDLTLGGDPALRPESSESWSAGMIFTPRAIKGLRLSADWVQIDKRDAITSLIPFEQSVLNQLIEFFPKNITRAAPSDGLSVGKITAVKGGYVNFARFFVEAIDFAADYEVPTASFGTFTLSAKATRNIHITEQPNPSAAKAENVGGNSLQGYVPKLRGNASLTWQRHQWTLGLSAQYFSSTYYGIGGSQAIVAQLGTNHFEAQAYCDIFGRYAFGPNARFTALQNVDVSLNVNNIFNTEPPVTQTGSYYVSQMGDARLANYLISVRKTF